MKKKRDENTHRHRAREKLFLFLALLVTLFFLSESPENLNSFTGASTISSFTESNYFLGIMLFFLTMVFAFYILNLIRKSKGQIWHPEPLGEEDISIATWDTELELPLDEKIHQINKELKDLMKDKPQILKNISKKITTIPNIKEVRLRGELERIQNKIHGYSRPAVLEAPKNKAELDKNLLDIRKQLRGLDNMKIKRVRVREEVPSRETLTRVIEKREVLKKELDNLHVKMHESSARQERKKEEISQDVLEINKKIAELEKMPIKKVKMRTGTPTEKHFTHFPSKEKLKSEFTEISKHLSEDKKVKEESKKKSKALQEIEEKLAKLKDLD